MSGTQPTSAGVVADEAGAADGTAPGPAADGNALLASLTTPAVSADPYPVYARLRALGAFRASGSGAVFLTGYDDCAALLRDQGFRSQSPAWADRVTPSWRSHPAKVATFEAMLFRDPPDHTRLRRLVSAAFTPRQAERMRADIVAMTGRALDRLADAGADGGPVDLQDVLAGSLPIAVIASLVGVPDEDWPVLRTSMSALLRLVELTVSQQALAEANAGALALREYFAGLVADRRRAAGPDLGSALVAARDASAAAGTGPDDGFTEEELLQTLTFVFMAGVDTMTNLLANSTAALLAHPRQAALLRARPELVPDAVEEVLRYDAPVQLVGRVAAADGVSAGGLSLRADQLVVALLGAANRDPARFPAPDTFDVTRRGATVLSFGGGIHYCLGAPLARLQAGVFLTALLDRFPGLRLAGQPRRAGTVFRGFDYLPVALR
jgi:cytochrome P450